MLTAPRDFPMLVSLHCMETIEQAKWCRAVGMGMLSRLEHEGEGHQTLLHLQQSPVRQGVEASWGLWPSLETSPLQLTLFWQPSCRPAVSCLGRSCAACRTGSGDCLPHHAACKVHDPNAQAGTAATPLPYRGQLHPPGILKQLGEDCSENYLAAAVPQSSLDRSEEAPLLKVGVLHSEGETPPSRDRHLHRECTAAQPGLLLGVNPSARRLLLCHERGPSCQEG